MQSRLDLTLWAGRRRGPVVEVGRGVAAGLLAVAGPVTGSGSPSLSIAPTTAKTTIIPPTLSRTRSALGSADLFGGCGSVKSGAPQRVQYLPVPTWPNRLQSSRFGGCGVGKSGTPHLVQNLPPLMWPSLPHSVRSIETGAGVSGAPQRVQNLPPVTWPSLPHSVRFMGVCH